MIRIGERAIIIRNWKLKRYDKGVKPQVYWYSTGIKKVLKFEHIERKGVWTQQRN